MGPTLRYALVLNEITRPYCWQRRPPTDGTLWGTNKINSLDEFELLLSDLHEDVQQNKCQSYTRDK